MVICSANRFDDMSNARRWYKITGRLILLVTMVSLLFVCFSVNPSLAGIRHDLRISLHPESNRLLGRDYIEVQPEGQAKLTLSMSPRAIIRKMVVNEKVAPYHFSKGRLTVPLDPGRAAPSRIFVSYEAVFDDPYPEAPANSDNPGYGVTGIVGPKGTFLLSGSGWYPQGDHGASQFSIVVDAPEGIVAVTAGRSAGRKTEGRRTHSYWVVNHPSEGLSLSAGRYVVTETALGGIQVATYFLPQTQHLAERYIAATGRYLKMYAKLFGPYPFEKFAVVENFFPTGYGFPSYTLMGGAVLRLPFIVDVSLGHEIAHCWWGNGVKIDFATGNWSEGLTTYVADYLYKEQESTEAARQYRQQWLRNYAALIDENTDFPLARFIGRVDRQTKVIGYDKAAMVFHMLRKNLGEKAFWGALRDIFREKLFEEASWENFRLAFQRRAASGPHGNLKEFFAQWVFRDGGPDLALADLSEKRSRGAGGFRAR